MSLPFEPQRPLLFWCRRPNKTAPSGQKTSIMQKCVRYTQEGATLVRAVITNRGATMAAEHIGEKVGEQVFKEIGTKKAIPKK